MKENRQAVYLVKRSAVWMETSGKSALMILVRQRLYLLSAKYVFAEDK
jgi:hypothetical protein